METLTTLFTGVIGQEGFKTGLSILTVYSTHYGATKLYDGFCVPDNVQGYFMGLFTTGSPWCKVLLDTMKTTETQYSGVLLVSAVRMMLSSIGI